MNRTIKFLIISSLFVLPDTARAINPRIRITSPYKDALMQYSDRIGWYMIAPRGGGILPAGKKLKVFARIEKDNRPNSKILCRIRLLNAAGKVFKEEFLRPKGYRHKKISLITPLKKGFNRMTIIASMQYKPFHWTSDTITIYEAVDPIKTAGFKIPSDTRLKQFDKAEEQLKILNRKNPNDPRAHYYLGHLYYRKANWAKALHEMKLAAKYAPRNPAIYNDLGKLYHFQRIYDKAEKSFEKAISMRPNVYEFHKNLSVTSYLKGDRKKALKHIKILMGMTPGDPNLYQLAGVIALQDGNKRDGVLYLRKYIYYKNKQRQQKNKTKKKK